MGSQAILRYSGKPSKTPFDNVHNVDGVNRGAHSP